MTADSIRREWVRGFSFAHVQFEGNVGSRKESGFGTLTTGAQTASHKVASTVEVILLPCLHVTAHHIRESTVHVVVHPGAHRPLLASCLRRWLRLRKTVFTGESVCVTGVSSRTVTILETFNACAIKRGLRRRSLSTSIPLGSASVHVKVIWSHRRPSAQGAVVHSTRRPSSATQWRCI